jgi:hypothetical protein
VANTLRTPLKANKLLIIKKKIGVKIYPQTCLIQGQKNLKAELKHKPIIRQPMKPTKKVASKKKKKIEEETLRFSLPDEKKEED